MFVVLVKYLGLLAMSKILKTHPKSVQSHKDLILQCLDDKDESIRLRALDLLYGMVRNKDVCFHTRFFFRQFLSLGNAAYSDLQCQSISICRKMTSVLSRAGNYILNSKFTGI